MKSINEYINESLFEPDLEQLDVVKPKDKFELRKIIRDYINTLKISKKIKPGDTIDLNWIDVSLIDDLHDFLNINYQYRERYFRYNLNVSEWDVSNVADMDYAFAGCVEFNCDLSKWNVSNVKSMSHMFSQCHNFNCDLSKWNVSKVESMCEMFIGCKKFNSDLSKWNVSNVKNMSHMFSGCENFNSDLSKWNVSNAEDISAMFWRCEKFNSDLSKWNVSNVKGSLDYVFGNCKSLKKIPDWIER